MYTLVFYHKDTHELIRTLESGDIPRPKEAKHPYYIVEGEFDGVIDPSKGIDARSREERLEEELAKTQERLKVTEDTFFQFLNE